MTRIHHDRPEPRQPARKIALGVLPLALLLHGSAGAGSGGPEDTVLEFYTHVAKHQCAAAARLAEGYSPERCKAIHFLKPPQMVKQIASMGDQATVGYRVEYSRTREPDKLSCDEVKQLKLVRRERWIIDWRAADSEIGACAPSVSDAIGMARLDPEPPDLIPPAPPLPAPAAPKATPSPAMTPATVEPAPLPRHPAAVATTASLLRTWSSEDLLGRPGDERIINLPTPDRNPPSQREPKGRLPGVPRQFAESIRRVRLPEGRKLVALTFDLCEQADDRTGYDRQIVNFLRAEGIPATFFASGKWLRSHEDKALQLMADPNFEIGNHGWTHGNLRVLRGQRMLDQIVWTQAEYGRLWDILDRRARTHGLEDAMRVIPRQPPTLRFPYGTCDATALRAANDLGLLAIQWDVVSGDAAPRTTPEVLARTVVGGVRPGSIVVFHANGRGHGTAGALPRIVGSLRAKGYGFTTVSGLLREGEPETADQCYEMRPGDNLYIDAKFGDGTGER
jgi:peptidoglycan/xylan/chitin deacetylase (PgdA/CDA1 family)